MVRDQALPESCQVCGITRELSFFLHNICFRGNISRLCTNCLLKNHTSIFCPICFQVYDDTFLPALRVLCRKCPSIAHRSCVVDSANSDDPVRRFHCPSCADPKYSYFKLNRNNPSINEATAAEGRGDPISVPASNADGAGDPVSVSARNADEEGNPVSVPAENADGEGNPVSVSAQKSDGEGGSVSASSQNAQNYRALDIESAKALVAAAEIAASSMNRAAAAARIDAERRCNEAALARKKAKEALGRLPL